MTFGEFLDTEEGQIAYTEFLNNMVADIKKYRHREKSKSASCKPFIISTAGAEQTIEKTLEASMAFNDTLSKIVGDE